jgi:hypothetical protein
VAKGDTQLEAKGDTQLVVGAKEGKRGHTICGKRAKGDTQFEKDFFGNL